DLPLRLYWLLALDPALDPGRPAAAWLAEALTRGGMTGPALELYRHELDERPAEALEAGTALLAAPAPAARLAEVAEARVWAAGRRKLRDSRRVSADFLEVVRRGWTEPFPAVRPLLVTVMDQMTARPQEWLAHLATAESASPAVLYQFAAVLGQHQDRLAEPP